MVTCARARALCRRMYVHIVVYGYKVVSTACIPVLVETEARAGGPL